MAKDVVRSITPVRANYQMHRGSVKSESGLFVTKHARAIFDFSGTDSAGNSNATAGSHGLGVFLPAKAVVTRAFYQVQTTFTDGSDDSATIAAKVTSTGDLVAAIAISDASNPWDAGMHGCLPGAYAERTVAGDTAIADAASQAASWIGPLSAEKELTITTAVHTLTAGRLILWVEYFLGE